MPSKRSRNVPTVVATHDLELEQDEQDNRAERYNHLLKPIRDLAENFNIDLATELEEYLDDLEDLTIAFQDHEGIKKLNFAEAALLIRGSSLIYSKKVDYLYDLVFKVLDSVTAQRDKRIRADLHDDEDTPLDEHGQPIVSDHADFVDDFLSLDDIPEDDNISLQRDGTTGGSPHLAEWDVDRRRTKASNFAVPLAFLQAANLQNGSANAFRLSTSQVHASGALLLNPSANMQYHHLSDHTTNLCVGTGLSTTGGLLGGAAQRGAPQDSPGHSPYAHHQRDDDVDMMHMEDDFGGGMDDFDGFDEADYSHLSGAAASPVPQRLSQRLFTDHPDDGTNRASDPGEGCPPTVDHWVLHDPHAGGGGQKPFRLGTKTHALPDLTQATAMPTGPIPLCASSKQLASKEFSYIVQRAQIQARKRRKKEKRAKRQRALDAEERKKRLAEEEYARAAAAGNGGNGGDGDGHQEEEQELQPEQAAEGNGMEDYHGGGGDMFDDGMDWGADDGYGSGGGGGPEDGGYDDEDGDSPRKEDASYAQLCRAHVAAYMRGTHQYAQETNLTRRGEGTEFGRGGGGGGGCCCCCCCCVCGSVCGGGG